VLEQGPYVVVGIPAAVAIAAISVFAYRVKKRSRGGSS